MANRYSRQDMDEKRELLRHALATLAYRATRALEGDTRAFATFSGTGGRQPAQILAHMGDLFDWALSMAKGNQQWHHSEPLPWAEAQEQLLCRRCRLSMTILPQTSRCMRPHERLFQAPIADALTHVGQLAMMRRLAGCPTAGKTTSCRRYRGWSRGRRSGRAGAAFSEGLRARGCFAVPSKRSEQAPVLIAERGSFEKIGAVGERFAQLLLASPAAIC